MHSSHGWPRFWRVVHAAAAAGAAFLPGCEGGTGWVMLACLSASPAASSRLAAPSFLPSCSCSDCALMLRVPPLPTPSPGPPSAALRSFLPRPRPVPPCSAAATSMTAGTEEIVCDARRARLLKGLQKLMMGPSLLVVRGGLNRVGGGTGLQEMTSKRQPCPACPSEQAPSCTCTATCPSMCVFIGSCCAADRGRTLWFGTSVRRHGTSSLEQHPAEPRCRLRAASQALPACLPACLPVCIRPPLPACPQPLSRLRLHTYGLLGIMLLTHIVCYIIFRGLVGKEHE
jgi:hypothetical protein